jgi:hypothetical protein
MYSPLKGCPHFQIFCYFRREAVEVTQSLSRYFTLLPPREYFTREWRISGRIIYNIISSHIAIGFKHIICGGKAVTLVIYNDIFVLKSWIYCLKNAKFYRVSKLSWNKWSVSLISCQRDVSREVLLVLFNSCFREQKRLIEIVSTTHKHWAILHI